ncbi:precorrin-2 C(20)-methyltransferase [Zongyangia hominis]|uniref:Precorrin-2 C(20)-methyltransferase n=1 Tax=Zongyangia hominis TaxID=2763677 RepID=A0A926EA96_9FIRM|nr:precorrin-2 C(20)-methyltransferase [Zongyangia hominis]MBC8569290.1 precorrin-2 C(20)-methyltransferase [Zongyangia hominis]
MKGTLYGVGVGPGAPELVTKKAVRVMEESDVIALPASGAGDCAALRIARRAADIEGKELLFLPLPMVRDGRALRQSREEAAKRLCRELEKGRQAAFLTLGDPTVYSTYLYLHRLVEEAGYPAYIIPGVPSFCAAAARLGESLCENGEMLHIVPASYDGALDALSLPGTKVLMKAGRTAAGLRDTLEKRDLLSRTRLVVDCGMEGEKVYPTLEGQEIPESYFSLYIIKDEED